MRRSMVRIGGGGGGLGLGLNLVLGSQCVVGEWTSHGWCEVSHDAAGGEVVIPQGLQTILPDDIVKVGGRTIGLLPAGDELVACSTAAAAAATQ
jgi:hypothetical protein